MKKKKYKVGMKRSTRNILMGVFCVVFALFCLFLKHSAGFFAFFMILATAYFTLVIKGLKREREFRDKVKDIEQEFSSLDFDENEKAFFSSLTKTEKKKKKGGFFSKKEDDDDEYEAMSQKDYEAEIAKLDAMLGTDEENRVDDDNEDDEYVNYDEEDDE